MRARIDGARTQVTSIFCPEGEDASSCSGTHPDGTRVSGSGHGGLFGAALTVSGSWGLPVTEGVVTTDGVLLGQGRAVEEGLKQEVVVKDIYEADLAQHTTACGVIKEVHHRPGHAAMEKKPRAESGRQLRVEEVPAGTAPDCVR